MSHSFKPLVLAVFGLAALAVRPVLAGDASDVARETKLPQPVVETTIANVDAFFASAGAPSNHMVSSLFKQLTHKAIRDLIGKLEDRMPGKISEASAEEKNATYKAVVRSTRHDTTETRECVDNVVTLTGSEGVPVVKDGAFIVDLTHPRVTTTSWNVTFCRTPAAGGGYSDWALVPAGK